VRMRRVWCGLPAVTSEMSISSPNGHVHRVRITLQVKRIIKGGSGDGQTVQTERLRCIT
jgi:hypothetical protein